VLVVVIIGWCVYMFCGNTLSNSTISNPTRLFFRHLVQRHQRLQSRDWFLNLRIQDSEIC